MSGILDIALKNPNLKDKNLAQSFGYGAPFGQRYRSWLHKTGMTKMGLPMELTPMGEVIYKKDPKFETLTAQWFLQHELVTDPERSEAWHYFSIEFLPKHPSFTESELLEGITEKLRPHSEQHFGLGSKLNQQILRKIIQVYTEESGLGQLGLIKKEDDHFIRLKPKVLGPWKSTKELEGAF